MSQPQPAQPPKTPEKSATPAQQAATPKPKKTDAELLKEKEIQLQVSIKQNASLVEKMISLQKELDKLKSLPLNGDTQSLMTEFSKRIGDMESKYEAMRKERDALKRSQDENILKREIAKLNETLTTKQRDLDRYKGECEALNKRLSSSETELKKLLSEKKAYESHISNLSDKLAAATSLSESRAERIAQLELQERRSSDALEGLRDVSEASAKSQERWERRVSELTTQNADLQTALEKAWRDIAEAKMSHTQSQEAAEAELYEKTSRLQAEHKKALAQVKADAAAREEELTAGVTELRAALQRAEDDAAWREEEHAREIRELQKRTEAMEARGDAMASHALDSTLPLLRQIEALQQAATARAEASDEMEKRLRSQLRDAEVALAEAVASNSGNDVKLKSVLSKNTDLEKELTSNKSALDEALKTIHDRDSKLKALEEKLALTESDLSTVTAQSEGLRADYEELSARHKSLIASSRSLSALSSTSITPPSSPSPRLKSPAIITIQAPGSSASNTPLISPAVEGRNGISNSNSLQELTQIEKLNNIIAKKDSELVAVNEQLTSLNTSKQSLQVEIVKMSEKLGLLEGKLAHYIDVEKRYTASLVLLGEQKELVQELRLDIDDMKANYRFQLEQLAQENEALKKRVGKK